MDYEYRRTSHESICITPTRNMISVLLTRDIWHECVVDHIPASESDVANHKANSEKHVVSPFAEKWG